MVKNVFSYLSEADNVQLIEQKVALPVHDASELVDAVRYASFSPFSAFFPNHFTLVLAWTRTPTPSLSPSATSAPSPP